MTNHWIDLANADVIMVCGSNVAENHPVAVRWMEAARGHGAVILSVDPRFTRTSAWADVYCPMRSGTDIAFVGGMIRYAFANERINRKYLVPHTNASFLVSKDYSFDDGLFSGFDPAARSYDPASWAYERDDKGRPITDPTLTHERCVLNVVKRHYERYDPKTVCRITGSPRDVYERICDIFTGTFAPDRAGTWLYAMGATQSTHGAQNVRAYALLQLLLGNIGIAGGGVNALRGESNVQGSTDMGLLFNALPGYLKAPTEADPTLALYLERYTPLSNDPMSANWLSNTPKYLVSLLKAWYPGSATAENEFAYQYLPKSGGDCSYLSLFKAIEDGVVKGLVVFGQNPAVSGPSAGKQLEALSRLGWMVCADLFANETATFWKRPGVDPATVETEVFLLPACASVEKEGSITNSGRWAQWRYRAAAPPGDARSDLWILDRLYRELRTAYGSGGRFPDPILNLSWGYEGGPEGPDPHVVAQEVNGGFTADAVVGGRGFVAGEQAPSFALLADDGSTRCGNWLYCGSYPGRARADNRMAWRKRQAEDERIGLFSGWAWCWPANRRILYSRASVDESGAPFDPRRYVIRWDPARGAWEGDVPDGPWPPSERYAFIMLPEGRARLFASGLADGPLPEHYEPWEGPVGNLLSGQRTNPVLKVDRGEANGRGGDPSRYPIVATTYRVSEHWQTGAMTRNAAWLVELIPSAFAEIGEDLAREKGIENGDRVLVETARGEVEVFALVTRRFSAFVVGETRLHQIGLVWHFGYAGRATGEIANILTPQAADPNSLIPEYKAFLCSIRRAGRGIS